MAHPCRVCALCPANHYTLFQNQQVAAARRAGAVLIKAVIHMWRVRIAHSSVSAIRANHLLAKKVALEQKIAKMLQQRSMHAIRRVKGVMAMYWRYQIESACTTILRRWLNRSARTRRQLLSTQVAVNSLARAAWTEVLRRTIEAVASWRVRSLRALMLGVVARPLFIAGFIKGAHKTTPNAECDRVAYSGFLNELESALSAFE